MHLGASVVLCFWKTIGHALSAIGLIAQEEPSTTAEEPEERLTLTAAREIVLQCGRASIVLTRAGKVLVRGAYLSLRASGAHRSVLPSVADQLITGKS